MSKKSGANVDSKPSNERKAVVETVFCDSPIWTKRGLGRIFMTTEDGLSTPSHGWCNDAECKVYEEEFKRTWQDIKSGAITRGTEVTIKCDSNGIACFYL